VRFRATFIADAPPAAEIAPAQTHPSDLTGASGPIAETVRLLTKEQEMEDRKKLTLLLEISRGLNQEDDLDILLRRIVDHALELTGADRGFLYLKPTTNDEEIIVTRHIDREAIFGSRSEISTSVLDEVMHTRRPVLLSDTLDDAQFRSRQSIRAHNLRTIMCAPLIDPFFRPVNESGDSGRLAAGVLYVDGTARGTRFTPLDRELFESLAAHAAVGLANLQQRRRLIHENQVLKQQIRNHFSFDQLIGTAPAMHHLKGMLEKVAPSHAGVLIQGESGTGKELVARILHSHSPRESGPFLCINCAALAESVLESELFGVEAGVATGVKRRSGLFVQADRGTLFLDEIGDMPLAMQAKILRVLQERRVRPVGGRQSIPVDVRIVCATNKDIWQETREGRFREDLLFRIDVITLRLPPLRERVEDIPVLARFFLTRFARQMEIPVPGIALSALKIMAQYPWPGNVRELENQMQRALVLTEIGKDIEPEDLSPRIVSPAMDHHPSPDSRVLVEEPVPRARSGVSRVAAGITGNPGSTQWSIKTAVSELEMELIRRALVHTGGNKAEAARLLGLSREGLRLKLLRRTESEESGENA
ncbi:sigma-54-dependent Fis family transcriptional regulator, partial [bacterium]|nr:sigma-54-dependent Fis family transcriptional regulator [candidate division CSSED10-310 bacterium]